MRPQNTAKLHNHVCHTPWCKMTCTLHFSLCVSVYKISLFLVENQYTCVSVFTNSYAASRAHRCAGCFKHGGKHFSLTIRHSDNTNCTAIKVALQIQCSFPLPPWLLMYRREKSQSFAGRPQLVPCMGKPGICL